MTGSSPDRIRRVGSTLLAAALGIALLAACEPPPPPDGSDLGVTAIASGTVGVALDEITYQTAVITNHGSATAVNAKVSYLVPKQLSALGLTGDRVSGCTGPLPFGDSDYSYGVCQLGALAAGASTTVELRLQGLAEVSATEVHFVVGSAGEPTPAGEPNTATVDFRVFNRGALVFSDPGPVTVGSTFQVTAQGGGQYAVLHYISVGVPASLHLDSLVVPGTTPGNDYDLGCSGTGVVTCVTPAAVPSADIPLRFTFTALEVGGPVTVTFNSSSEVGGVSGSTRILVVDSTIGSDVHVAFDPVELAVVGEPLDLVGLVRTGGPVAHEDVVATVAVPAGFTLSGATWGPSFAAVPCTTVGQQATCNIGPMAGYRTLPLIVSVVPTATTPAATVTASVSSSTVQDVPDPEPDDVELTFEVHEPYVDLGFSDVSLGSDPFVQGTTSTVFLNVENFGTVTANGTTLTATIPAQVVPLRGDMPQPAPAATKYCSISGQTISCAIGALGPRKSQSIRLHYRADAPTSGNVDLAVTSDVADVQPDPNPSTQAVPFTAVAPQTDLAVTFPGEPLGPAIVGHAMSVPATVTNLAGATSETTDVAITAPVGWTIESLPGVPCVVSGQTVTCTRGWGLASGDSFTVNVSVTPGAAVSAAIFEASITGSLPDPDPASNLATTTVDAIADEVDLSLSVKTAPTVLPSAPGSAFIELQIANAGPANATGVTFTTTMPAGVTALSAAWGCTIDGAVVTCFRPTLEPGDTTTVGLTANYSDVSQPVTHHFAVTADQPEHPAQTGANELDLELRTGGRFSGVVTLPGGAPAAGTVIRAWSLTDVYFATGSATAAADGAYSFGALRPGQYRIHFTPPSGSGLPNEWFDNQTVRSNATLFSVSAGGETYVVNGQLGL